MVASLGSNKLEVTFNLLINKNYKWMYLEHWGIYNFSPLESLYWVEVDLTMQFAALTKRTEIYCNTALISKVTTIQYPLGRSDSFKVNPYLGK